METHIFLSVLTAFYKVGPFASVICLLGLNCKGPIRAIVFLIREKLGHETSFDPNTSSTSY